MLNKKRIDTLRKALAKRDAENDALQKEVKNLQERCYTLQKQNAEAEKYLHEWETAAKEAREAKAEYLKLVKEMRVSLKDMKKDFSNLK